MELDTALSQMVGNIDGALGAALGGMDGLLVEQFAGNNKINLATVIAEHANILKNARIAYSGSLAAGNIKEVLVTAENMLGYTRQINNEFFLTVVLDPKGNIGKARILSERAARQIQEMLG